MLLKPLKVAAFTCIHYLTYDQACCYCFDPKSAFDTEGHKEALGNC